MQPVDNSQFTEEQRVEAYRVESMQHLARQTKALESIRAVLLATAIIGAIVGILALFFLASIAHM